MSKISELESNSDFISGNNAKLTADILIEILKELNRIKCLLIEGAKK